MALPKGGTIRCRVDLLPMLPKRSVGAEVGVLKGRFSRRVLQHVNPRIFYLVDVWEQIEGSHYKDYAIRRALRVVLHDFRSWIKDGVVRPLRGRSLEMVTLIPEESLDWVYIDGDHTEEGALHDFREWGSRVKRGGYIMGHDYEGKERYADRGASHVRRAVERWAQDVPLGPIGLTVQKPSTFWVRKTW